MTLLERWSKPEGRRSQKRCMLSAIKYERKGIPEEWTKSVIVTIPKKGDLSQCSNYRKNYRTITESRVGKVLDDGVIGEVESPDGKAFIRRASWIQEGQKYCAPDPEANCREGNTKRKALYQLLHWLPKGIWLDQTCYLGNLQVISHYRLERDRLKFCRISVKEHSQQCELARTARLVQNHSRYTTRRSDIVNNFHLVSWKSDGHNKREWTCNLSTWPQVK